MMWRYTFPLLVLVVFSSPAISGDLDHAGCDSSVTVYVNKMGIVNEKKLQEHIEAARRALEKIQGMNTHDRERRFRLKEHFENMQQAMTEMHNLKLSGDCAAAAHGASLQVRIEVLEKRMDMIQDMLEQLIKNQSEGAKE